MPGQGHEEGDQPHRVHDQEEGQEDLQEEVQAEPLGQKAPELLLQGPGPLLAPGHHQDGILPR